MERLRKSPTLATSPLLILFLLVLDSITLSLAANRLYEERDNVLPRNELDEALREGGVGKLVQFMNGFCKDSQRFIPTFTQLARDVHRWNRVLKVYVVDCAIEAAGNDCRLYKIRDTPTLRYFPSEVQIGSDLGTRITIPKMESLPSMEQELASQLSLLKHSVLGQPIFELLTRQDNVSTVFDAEIRSHLVLVYQPRGSHIGRDTLLDLTPIPQVEVRILEDRGIFLNFGVPTERYEQEHLVVIDLAGKLTYISPENPTSEALVFAVKELVQPPPPTELEQHQPVNLRAAVRQLIFENYRTRSVYLADLERAIDHILRKQLVKVPRFIGKQHIVLRNIVVLLHYLNPLGGQDGKTYLKLMYKGIETVIDNFRDVADVPFAKDSFYGDDYVGCMGSRPGLRGFNCSLWVLFHYLTVAASRPPIRFKPGAVLWMIHGYVNYFMDCPECYTHLWFFAQERKIDDVKTHDEEILWLWEAHNHFNRKLAGDRTEDPRFPKMQFPLEEDCPKCRNSEAEWQTDEVLNHLKEVYSLENLNWFGLPTPLSYLHNTSVGLYLKYSKIDCT